MLLQFPIKFLIAGLFLSFGMNFAINAQSYELDQKTSSLMIYGTSNIHDWTISANGTKGSLKVNFEEEKLKDIENLTFMVTTKALKSGKEGMDRNTYKALNADKYQSITFEMTDVELIEQIGPSEYTVRTNGKLEIAGVTKDIELCFELVPTQQNLMLKGEHRLNMAEFDIQAPTAMFGTIKTGETVVIKFESNFNKSTKL
ncbi:YceI family protein [Christiangramia salexigens]|uniref:Lipid/polyisoprenoid-binding YceI-like domain-containing protein n=1 Tax=Christiangramia salexigens TaxID=1913577 RepID=A0A1L3J1Y1_9FLAO|nr:YceI family protein [Christiangramia salexigens]APG59131.1 hypothetical protein LPB144_01350 [Christiangramia salexigens]